MSIIIVITIKQYQLSSIMIIATATRSNLTTNSRRASRHEFRQWHWGSLFLLSSTNDDWSMVDVADWWSMVFYGSLCCRMVAVIPTGYSPLTIKVGHTKSNAWHPNGGWYPATNGKPQWSISVEIHQARLGVPPMESWVVDSCPQTNDRFGHFWDAGECWASNTQIHPFLAG